MVPLLARNSVAGFLVPALVLLLVPACFSEETTQTVTFQYEYGGLKLTSTARVQLKGPTSLLLGDRSSFDLTLSPGESSISFTFEFAGTKYPVSLPSFQTPIGSIQIPITDLGVGSVMAKFSTFVTANISSDPTGLVSPSSLKFDSQGTKSFSLNAPNQEGTATISVNCTYDGSVEIILKPILGGEITVLGPFTISSIPGTPSVSATVKIESKPAPWRLLTNPMVIVPLIAVVAGIAAAVIVKRR